MSASHIILVGGPDSGKSNYVGRLWAALRARKGRLCAPQIPTDIQYVEEILEHLMLGEFAPRSAKDFEQSRRDFVVPVVRLDSNQTEQFEIVVPDVTGELWQSAVETSEIDTDWMNQMQQAVGALLFVRVLSNQIVAPLDWVTTEDLLRMHEPDPAESVKIPTQVVLCELLRFLELTLKSHENGAVPRVAVIVTAWDLLDSERQEAGPMSYLQSEFPLFAGKLLNTESLEVNIFGVTVTGGDFEDTNFRNTYLESGGLETAGYCIVEKESKVIKDVDLTYPIAWLLER